MGQQRVRRRVRQRSGGGPPAAATSGSRRSGPRPRGRRSRCCSGGRTAAQAGEADAARRDEAAAVAALLVAMHDADAERWQVQDRDAPAAPRRRPDEPLRPPRWGDVALLFRATTGLETYEQALREAGVPYRVDGGKAYFCAARGRRRAALPAGGRRPERRTGAVRRPALVRSSASATTTCSCSGPPAGASTCSPRRSPRVTRRSWPPLGRPARPARAPRRA